MLILATVAVAALCWHARRSAARGRELMLLCRRAGLEFFPLDPLPDSSWLPFPTFGHARQGIENVVWDPRIGSDVRVFDLWYEDEADAGQLDARRWLACGAVPLPFSSPGLRVTPRSLLGEALDVMSDSEVRLELDAFDRRFRVDTDDRRFAFAFLDQPMMEALLALPESVSVEVNEDVLLLRAPRMSPATMVRMLDVAGEIRRRIPRVASSLFPPRPTRGPHEARWLQGRWSPDPTGDA